MKTKLVFLYFLVLSMSILGQESFIRVDLKKELHAAQADTTKIFLNIKISNSFPIAEEDSTFFYFDRALKLANEGSLKPELAKYLFEKARSFMSVNEFEYAINNLNEALIVNEELDDTEEISTIYNYIGYCYINLYAEDKAIDYYLKSLKICKDLDHESGIAMNYVDIGNLYYNQENYGFAKKYFQDALTIYEKLNDKQGVSTCYTNLGNSLSDEGNFEDGIDYFKQSIILQEELGDNKGIATNYNNLGDCYIQKGENKAAQVYFLKALKLAKRIDDRNLIAVIYLNMAEAYKNSGKYNSTIIYATKSLKLSKELGRLTIELANLLFLAESYEALENLPKALFYYKKYDKVKEQLIALDKTKKVQLFDALNELEKTHFTIKDLSNKNEIAELKYKNEKKISYFLIVAIVIFAFLIILSIHQQTAKKKAYNLLEFKNYQVNKMNDEIQEQRDYLKQLNKTKDKFFSIIAHDLKNPFNSIKGFTELLIDNSEEYDEEKRLKFLRIIKNSTNKASVLLNNLLIWANSQSGNLNYNPVKTELVKSVLNVVSLLEIQAVKKEIEIYNNIDHNLIVKADENMLNTILRNLISNAIKFTKQKGEIRILSALHDNVVEVTIKDNGIGIPKEAKEKLFNLDVKNINIGTANEQGSGLGLVLCKDFIEKHGGKIWVNSVENEGSEFVFTLPLWDDESDKIF